MASSPRPRRKLKIWRHDRRRAVPAGRIPWGWLCLTVILYATLGTLVSSFPVPYWVWNLVVGGVLAQALALAGPKALGRCRWWRANALVLLTILGTAAIAVAVGLAMGFVGTDDLDAIALKATAFEVIRVSLVALMIPALGAIIGAETGDRLLALLNRWQSSAVLAATCLFGIGLGSLIGLLLVE